MTKGIALLAHRPPNAQTQIILVPSAILWYDGIMVDTKHKFSSFAAPTPDDIAAFDALSYAEQKTLIEDEIAKGFDGEPIPWTPDLKDRIMTEAQERISRRNAKI